MAVWMEDGVWLPTDVCVPMASPELSVREVKNATMPLTLHHTVCTAVVLKATRAALEKTWCWMAVVFCDCGRFLLRHAVRSRNVVCCGTFACQAWAQKWPLFSTSALKRCSGECNVSLNVCCLLTEDLPTSCGCSLAHVAPKYTSTRKPRAACPVFVTETCTHAAVRVCFVYMLGVCGSDDLKRSKRWPCKANIWIGNRAPN